MTSSVFMGLSVGYKRSHAHALGAWPSSGGG
jgi:hypothetical protein